MLLPKGAHRRRNRLPASIRRRLVGDFPRWARASARRRGHRPAADGALVDGAGEKLESAGVRRGDVIVGLDGWRVRTLDQYTIIRLFKDTTSNVRDMRIRVWRQTRYIDLDADVRGRLFSVRMRTFGTPGPSYQSPVAVMESLKDELWLRAASSAK